MSMGVREIQISFSVSAKEYKSPHAFKMFLGIFCHCEEIYSSQIYDCIINSNSDNLCQQVYENKQTYTWWNEQNYTASWKEL